MNANIEVEAGTTQRSTWRMREALQVAIMLRGFLLPMFMPLALLAMHADAATVAGITSAAIIDADHIDTDTLTIYYRKGLAALDEFDPPSSALLVAGGALGLLVVRRRQRQNS